MLSLNFSWTVSASWQSKAPLSNFSINVSAVISFPAMTKRKCYKGIIIPRHICDTHVNLFNTVFIIKISILAKLCVWDRNHWKEWHLWNFTFCCGREDLSIPYIHTIYSSNCIKILFHIKTGKMIFWVKELHHLAIKQSVKLKELALPMVVRFPLWDAFISCPQWPISYFGLQGKGLNRTGILC